MSKETQHEKDTRILKDYVNKCVENLEKGEKELIRGGYINHSYKDSLIDSNCSKIVSKLSSLGYEYTTNHGHGCRDYWFSKKIEL